MAQKAKSSYHLKQLQGKVPFRYDRNSPRFQQGAWESNRRGYLWAEPKPNTQDFTERHKPHPCVRLRGAVPDNQTPLLSDCYRQDDLKGTK